MKLYRNALSALAALGLSTSAHAAGLVITEFMADPSGTDADREWVEIYNATSSAINLTGYKVGDNPNKSATATGEGMHVFPDGTIINPGQVFVIAQRAVNVTNPDNTVTQSFFGLYGFKPNFEILESDATVPNMPHYAGWGADNSILAIANPGDDVLILDPQDNVIDGTNHGTVATYFTGAATLGSNQSYERVPANGDTDTAGDWVVRTSGNATPGVVSVPEPGSMALLSLVCCATRRRRRK